VFSGTCKANTQRTGFRKTLPRTLWRILGGIVLVLLCLIPGLILSHRSYQSPWTKFRLARARWGLHDGHLPTYTTGGTGYRSEHIGSELVSAALLDAIALAPESVELLPIGSLLIAVLYYAVMRKLEFSSWIAGAVALFSSWYYPKLGVQFGTDSYVWTNILFLSFLILLWDWMQKRTPCLVLLMVLVFVAAFLHYHTTPIWIITSLSSASLLLKFAVWNGRRRENRSSWALPLFCSVVYLAFDTVVYGNGLARIRNSVVLDSLATSIVTRALSPLFYRSTSDLDPLTSVYASPTCATWTTLLVMLILVGVVSWWCLAKATALIKQRSMAAVTSGRESVFISTIVVTTAVHALIYSLYGALSLRLIPVTFPLILPLIGREMNWGQVYGFLVSLGLAILAMIGFASYAPSTIPDILVSETGVAPRLLAPDGVLLCDANVYGTFLLASAAERKVLDLAWMTPDSYRTILEGPKSGRVSYDYVIVDKSGKPIITQSWGFLKPWSDTIDLVEQNRNLDKIYDSSALAIYTPSGVGLPAPVPIVYQPMVEGTLSGNGLRMFISVLVLFLLPGMPLVPVSHNRTCSSQAQPVVSLGLSIGFSVAVVTIIGYITNFSALGLGYLVPMCTAFPWMGLGIRLLASNRRSHIAMQQARQVFISIVGLALWASLAAYTDMARASPYSGPSELFVTQDQQNKDALTIGVISQRPGDFTVHIEMNDVRLGSIGPRRLQPQDVWSEQWIVPSGAEGWLRVMVEHNRVFQRELEFSIRSNSQIGQHFPESGSQRSPIQPPE